MSYIILKLSQLVKYVKIYGAMGVVLFFKYNISTKIMKQGKKIKITLPSGHICQIRCGTTDLSTFHQIWISEEYNLHNIKTWKLIWDKYKEISLGGKTPLIMDCGANIGLSVLYFRHVFPEAWIIGFEPERENYRMTVDNIGDLQGITLHHAAVWDQIEMLKIKSDPNGFSSGFQTVQAAGRQAGELVETMTVDAAVAGMGDRYWPFLVKMDVEGAERRALYGAVETQKAGAILIIEPHDWLEGVSGSLDGIETLVTHWSFDFFAQGENVIFVPTLSKSGR